MTLQTYLAMTIPEFHYVLDMAPEHDVEWLLSLCLLILQRHDEVSHTTACAVIVHVLLRKRKVFPQASFHKFAPQIFRYGEVHFPVDWVCIFITQVWLSVVPVKLSVTHNWYQNVAYKMFVQRGAITSHISKCYEELWVNKLRAHEILPQTGHLLSAKRAYPGYTWVFLQIWILLAL